MNKIRFIKRATAKRMIETEDYKRFLNFVSACFEDIYLYYKRVKRDYFIILTEDTEEPWSNMRIHCDLEGFLDEVEHYDEGLQDPSDDDIEAILQVRPTLAGKLDSCLSYAKCHLLRCSIEDKDESLEKALMARYLK